MWFTVLTLAVLSADVDADAGVAPASTPLETTVHVRLLDPRRIAGSAQVIGVEELERHEHNDIHRVLASAPGVYVREEDGAGLRPNIGLRGVNADRSSKVTLMEDGVLFAPAPYSAAAAYYFPLVTRMVGLEVYKGPGSIRFGPQTIGGAINLRTREVPQSLAGELDVALGNFGQKKAHAWVGVGDENKGLLLEGATFGSDGFKVLDGGGSTGFLKGELMAKGRWFTDKSRGWRTGIELKASVASEDSHETYLGLTDADFQAAAYRRYASTALDEMKWWHTQVEATHVLTVGTRFSLRTTAYRHDLDRNWYRMQQFRNGPDLYELLTLPTNAATASYLRVLQGAANSTGADQQLMQAGNHRIFFSQGVQTTATLTLDTGPFSHDLEAGLRLHNDQIHRLHTQRAFEMLDGALRRTADPEFFVLRNIDSTLAFAGYLTDTISWGNLLVAPGVRVESVHTASVDEDLKTRIEGHSLVPLLGLGAVYSFAPGFSLLGGVHQGFSPVNPGQDPSVQPERAVNSELGGRLAFRGLRLEAIGFWSEYSNITGECTGSTGCVGGDLNRQFNGGRARVLGAEVLASVKRSLPRELQLGVDVNYTLTHATFLSDFTSENALWGSVQAGDFLPYIPLHQGRLQARLTHPEWDVSLGVNWYGAMREHAGQGVPLPNYAIADRVTLDATAAYLLGDFRFYATGTNLLNTPALVSRLPFGARGQAPMMVQVGVKYGWR